MLRNREITRDISLFAACGTVLTVLGFCLSLPCGLLVLTACLTGAAIHFAAEVQRYRRLKKLGDDLEALLLQGTPLPIREYAEGELSILANQIQKITLRLLESGEAMKEDKLRLADSLADISHQLRTPLTAMNLTVSMLASPELSDRRRIGLTRELRNLLSRTEWLVESLLKLSRLDAGVVTMAREPVAVGELIRRASAPLAISMDIRDQRLVADCREERFLGDITWTAEALGNVLKNCMEHTPPGGSITVSALETALFTQITVKDTGEGFAPADIPHLFERFYKGANASDGSCGIGLALARNIIAAQDGTIQAMNGESGAKFVIKFPKQVI